MTPKPRLPRSAHPRHYGRWAAGPPPNAKPRPRRIALLLLAGVRPVHIHRALGISRARVSGVRALLGLRPGATRGFVHAESITLIPVVLALRQAAVPYDEIADRVKRKRSDLLRMIRQHLGPLPKACAKCSRPAQAWHHTSYVPERVLPLCNACHARAHDSIGNHRRLCSPPSPGATPSKSCPSTAS